MSLNSARLISQSQGGLTSWFFLLFFSSFIYTDKVEAFDLIEDALSVLSLANKYNIARLKLICQEMICDLIEVENVLETAYMVDN